MSQLLAFQLQLCFKLSSVLVAPAGVRVVISQQGRSCPSGIRSFILVSRQLERSSTSSLSAHPHPGVSATPTYSNKSSTTSLSCLPAYQPHPCRLCSHPLVITHWEPLICGPAWYFSTPLLCCSLAPPTFASSKFFANFNANKSSHFNLFFQFRRPQPPVLPPPIIAARPFLTPGKPILFLLRQIL